MTRTCGGTWLVLIPETGALGHPEAVLLVNYCQPQVSELSPHLRAGRACLIRIWTVARFPGLCMESGGVASVFRGAREQGHLQLPEVCSKIFQHRIRRCCVASISVGAIIAAWAPLSNGHQHGTSPPPQSCRCPHRPATGGSFAGHGKGISEISFITRFWALVSSNARRSW
jgi:hypothetical protein